MDITLRSTHRYRWCEAGMAEMFEGGVIMDVDDIPVPHRGW
ncbi:hypothetical protein [Mycolicibacterium sp.]